MRKCKGVGVAVGWGGLGWDGVEGCSQMGFGIPAPNSGLHSAVRAPLPESMKQNTGVWRRLILN